MLKPQIISAALIAPPLLGHRTGAVTRCIQLVALPGVAVPAAALTEANGGSTRWTLDQQSQTVSLRTLGGAQ
jgi:hypothetical protein